MAMPEPWVRIGGCELGHKACKGAACTVRVSRPPRTLLAGTNLPELRHNGSNGHIPDLPPREANTNHTQICKLLGQVCAPEVAKVITNKILQGATSMTAMSLIREPMELQRAIETAAKKLKETSRHEGDNYTMCE